MSARAQVFVAMPFLGFIFGILFNEAGLSLGVTLFLSFIISVGLSGLLAWVVERAKREEK